MSAFSWFRSCCPAIAGGIRAIMRLGEPDLAVAVWNAIEARG